MLNKGKTTSDEVIADYEMVTAVWLWLENDVDPKQRGHTARELVWWLIKKHVELAPPGLVWCPVCSQKPIISPNAWQVLNLYRCQSEKAGDFEAERTFPGLVRLVRAAVRKKECGEALSKAEELASDVPMGGKPRGEDWYKERVGLAIEGLARHFQANDELLREALKAHALDLLPVPPPTVAASVGVPVAAVPPAQLPAAVSTVAPAIGQGPGAPAHPAAAVSPSAPAASQVRAPTRRMGRRVALAVLALVVVMAGLLFWLAPGPKPVDLRSLNVSGWLLSRQWATGEPGPLTILNLKTGEWRPFWPQRSPQGEWDPPAPFYVLDPVYNPATQLLAFGWIDGAHVHSLWVGPVIQGADGWPMVDRSRLREVLADCAGCSTFDWSPSGQWLLYNSPTGLAAVSLTTGFSQRLTKTKQDEWPTCSHDGQWLAYQRGQNDVVVLSSQDCLPVSHPQQPPRYLGRYKPAWRLSWSPDDQTLAFTSNMSGPTLVYTAPFQQLPQRPQFDESAFATSISADHCTDPIWVQRAGTPNDVVLYGCDHQTSADHHGSLVARPAPPDASWQGVLDEGIIYRDGLCWIPPL